MTPRTSPVACVDPCGKATAVVGTYAAEIEAEEQTAPTKPDFPSGKATPVVGSYAAEIARLDGKKKARLAPPTANFRKTAPGDAGDERGNPELACQPSRSTVAFELLRQRQRGEDTVKHKTPGSSADATEDPLLVMPRAKQLMVPTPRRCRD